MTHPHETVGVAASQKGQLRSSRLGGKIQVVETWYDDDPTPFEGCDLWISYQRTRPTSPSRWLYFYTIHVDLTLDPDALLRNMRKNFAREIRTADERDGLSYAINTSPSESDLEDYVRFYDGNPRTSDQKPLDRARLSELSRAGLVHLCEARDAEGVVVARHCLFCHDRSNRIQLSSLVSLCHGEFDKSRTSAVARANRWLFYQEFLFYKERGFQIYDLNGWYAGTEDEKRLNINQFKEGFRGKILYGFDCEEPVSLRGRIYVLLKSIKQLLLQPEIRKEIRRRRKKAPSLSEAGEP